MKRFLISVSVLLFSLIPCSNVFAVEISQNVDLVWSSSSNLFARYFYEGGGLGNWWTSYKNDWVSMGESTPRITRVSIRQDNNVNFGYFKNEDIIFVNLLMRSWRSSNACNFTFLGGITDIYHADDRYRISSIKENYQTIDQDARYTSYQIEVRVQGDVNNDTVNLGFNMFDYGCSGATSSNVIIQGLEVYRPKTGASFSDAISAINNNQQQTNTRLESVNNSIQQSITQQKEQTNAINNQTNQQQSQYEQQKNEEKDRENKGKNDADKAKGMFSFTAFNPFSGIFGLFSSGSSCVSIPTISSMVGSNDSHYCSWFSPNVRSILTPVVGSVSMMVLFGFFVRWLKSGKGYI